ncbi:dermonecrotic toxin domain-containing protein, partial [Pseudomonas karstica]
PKEEQLVQEVKPEPASNGGYKQESVDPDPGKKVANSQKVSVPVNIGPNINIDPVAQKISSEFKTIEQDASGFLKKKFAEMKAKEPTDKEKWDIDPDNTYLVTYDYNSQGEKPFPAKIIQRISLTQALIQNAQNTPAGKGYEVPFFSGGPDVKIQNSLSSHKPGTFDFSSRFSPYRENADITHNYQGIYKESSDTPAQTYNASNQSSITPKEFKSLIWNTDFQKPYTEFLDGFWNSHKEKYPVLAKAAFVKSAMTQHQEGSLSAEGRELVMRAAGLSGHQESWPDIEYEELQKNPPKDPSIEVGLLKIGEYQSTDLMYMTDHKERFDANGKKRPPLTLLYIPGNSSPLHSFNSQAEMRKWLAEQMADPTKRNAIASHFALKDKPNGWARAGIDETLAGLGTWPEKRETPGGQLSYDHRAFSGKWDPQEFITTEPNNLPFQEISKRQKDRSYADAAVKITSDGDVTKQNIIDGMEKAAKAAMFLTPLAFVVPEVALALDVFYLVDGLATAGIGVDDQVHGKPKGNERIVFGVLNAALVVAPKVIPTSGKSEGVLEEVAEAEANAEKEAAQHGAPEPEPAPPAEAANTSTVPEVNRLSRSQWGNISDYAVPDGEKLIKNAKLNSQGIYQVKGSQGEDRWFIRYTDDTHISQLYEIDSKFKLRDGYAQIIDPFTRKSVMTVHATAHGSWEPINGPGGIRLPWSRGTSSTAKSQLDEAIKNINKDQASFTEAERQQFSDQLTSLIQQSKAEESQSMALYTEAGSDEINNELRQQIDTSKYPQNVKEFLADFEAQTDYRGTAYRYAHVSPEGAAKLKNGVGKVFRDPGVQSSSTQPINAKGWETWAKDTPATTGNQSVIYMFDESISKKNLSSDILPDHVAVKPNASLEVLATKEKDGILYVYFASPTKMPKARYNLFDGSVARPF